jgi:hypothetical protein
MSGARALMRRVRPRERIGRLVASEASHGLVAHRARAAVRSAGADLASDPRDVGVLNVRHGKRSYPVLARPRKFSS